jgi:pimeloyl-ACP methyl ester carboxylesterase
VNNTLPVVACFPNYLEGAAHAIEEDSHGYIGESDTAYDYIWASKRALADGCSKRAAENGIGKHMSTAPVARDIIEIFERHGEWREQEAKRLTSADATMSDSERQQILDRTAYRPGEEEVQYLGFSYGTILGATLSTMYPSRIKRAILDGVADSHDYMVGGWSTNLRDTDMIFTKLGEYCFEGGRKNCAFFDPDGPAAIVEDFWAVINGLRHDPIPVPASDRFGPTAVTYSNLKRFIRDIVYNPILYFPKAVQVLHDLSQGNGTSLLDRVREQRPPLGEPLSKECLKGKFQGGIRRFLAFANHGRSEHLQSIVRVKSAEGHFIGFSGAAKFENSANPLFLHF